MRNLLGCLKITSIFLAVGINLVSTAPPLYEIEKLNLHRGNVIRAEPDPKYRLGREVIPQRYALTIRPVLDQDPAYERFTAPGEVTIRVHVDKVSEPSTQIRLHSTTINITTEATKVTRVDGTDFPVISLVEDVDGQIITVTVRDPLTTGDYDLYFSFVAPIPDGKTTSFGLYRSSYVAENGETRYIAVTDFESVDARRMTPCFDEPDLKAKWTISIIRQKAYHSLSNTRRVGAPEPVDENWEKDIYEESPDPMPTYLVALAVSDYTSETATTGLFNKPVTIWGPPPLIASDGGKYAPDMSAKAMDFFEKYLSFPYTFPKMDKIALNDFSAGAMENWGMNTYRTVRLIHHEGESTFQDKIAMTNTIAHELAHQWFGNSITMTWWDDLWLNEGFATYFATLGASGDDTTVVHPEYGWLDYIIVDSVQYAMQADVRGTTHPLHYEGLSTPAETRYGFDTISYDKGASILRMLCAFLTESVFKEAMTKYLTDRAVPTGNGNAEQGQLFDSIQSITGVQGRLPTPDTTVAQVLQTWTTQAGFPVLKVARTTGTSNVVTVTQESYVNDTRLYEPLAQTWYVPITVETAAAPYDPNAQPQWLLPTADNIQLNVGALTDADYVIINPQQTGYYRVLYDDNSFNHILNLLKTTPLSLNLKTRSAILDDYFSFGYNGYDSITKALDITEYLINERNLVPWATFVTNMAVPYRLLGRTGTFYYFRKYVRTLMAPALADIDFEPKDVEDFADAKLLRNRLVEWSCNLGESRCVTFAKRVVDEWRQNPGQRPLTAQPDLRPFVYCAAVANADNKEEIFNFIFQAYTAATAVQPTPAADADQLNLLRALTCSQDIHRLRSLVDLALSPSNNIRQAHRLSAIQYVGGNTVGLYVVLEALRENLDRVIEVVGLSGVSSIVTTLSNYVTSESEIGDIERFVQANEVKLESVLDSLQTSLSTMKNTNVNWMTNNYAQIRTWLLTKV